MQGKSTESFKKLVKIKAEEYSLDKFCEKKEKHSKISNLQYTELKTKDYLNTPGIPTAEVLNIFKWRVRMAPLGENFRGNQPLVVCPLCQTHLEEIKKKMTVKISIEDIYRDKITLEAAQELLKIQKMREKLLEERKS